MQTKTSTKNTKLPGTRFRTSYHYTQYLKLIKILVEIYLTTFGSKREKTNAGANLTHKNLNATHIV